MFIYVVIYLLSFIFSFCYAKCKDKYAAAVFKVLTFMVLFIPAALRYEIGHDYKNYVGFLQHYDLSNPVFEIGYSPIIWFIQFFSLDLHWFFVITSFISYLCIFSVVKKEYAFYSIPIYICTSYLFGLSGVRQALSVSIALVFVDAYTKKEYKKAILFYVLGFCFHKSSLFLIFVTVLASMKWKKLNPYRNALIVFVIYFVFFNFKVGNLLITKIIPLTPYANYLDIAMYFMGVERGSGLGILLKIFMYMAIVFGFSWDLQKSEHSELLVSKRCSSGEAHIRLYKVSCVVVFIYTAFTILVLDARIFNRLPQMLNPLFVLVFQCLGESKSKYKKIILPITLLGFFYFYYGSILANTVTADSGMGINPYQSILGR